MNELLPCPFCGSDAELYQSSTGFWVCCTETHGVECDHGNTHHNWSEKAAIEMWNRRFPEKVDSRTNQAK